jgi:hypothetical protein
MTTCICPFLKRERMIGGQFAVEVGSVDQPLAVAIGRVLAPGLIEGRDEWISCSILIKHKYVFIIRTLAHRRALRVA